MKRIVVLALAVASSPAAASPGTASSLTEGAKLSEVSDPAIDIGPRYADDAPRRLDRADVAVRVLATRVELELRLVVRGDATVGLHTGVVEIAIPRDAAVSSLSLSDGETTSTATVMA